MSFKDQMSADLGVFFNTSEFAETIVYNSSSIPAIINRFKDPDISGEVATRAEIMIKKASASVAYNDQVFFDGKTWMVERVDQSDEITIVLSVRRKEGYVFK